MFKAQTYVPLTAKFFCAPLLREHIRLELSSSEYKLDSLCLMIALMLRDGKSESDIVDATLLPRSIVDDVLELLENRRLIDPSDAHRLPENTIKLIRMNECVARFNGSSTQFFSDALLEKSFVWTSTANVFSTPDAEEFASVQLLDGEVLIDFRVVSNAVENILKQSDAREFADELKIMRTKREYEFVFVKRELRFCPLIGAGNFDGAVELNAVETIRARMPIKICRTSTNKKFAVDLVLGSVIDRLDEFEEVHSEGAVLGFKPESGFDETQCARLASSAFGEEISIAESEVRSIDILISQETAGDFL